MNSRKIAITGATGLLGGYIVAELIRCGYTDLTLLVRSASRLDKLYGTLDREGVAYTKDMFTVAELELNNPREMAEALHGVDTVFHAAAMVSMNEDSAKEIIEINVEMTSHVVNASLESGVRLLVHTSSIAALGGMKKGKMYIDEQTALEDLSSTSPYGQSKFFCENEVWRGHELGLNVVVVNPAVILGIGDRQADGSARIIRMLAKGVPFYTRGAVGYVDVRDVARAEVALVQCEEAIGERFVLAAENLSFKELISSAAEAAGNRKPIVCAGRWITEAVWRADATLSRMTGRKPAFTQATARSSQEKSYYCGEKIRKFINFDYTPIRRTIKECVTAYIKDTEKQ